jgi:hypothetical protein
MRLQKLVEMIVADKDGDCQCEQERRQGHKHEAKKAGD